MNETPISLPANQMNDNKIVTQSRAVVRWTGGVCRRGLLCFAGLFILVLGLVFALSLLAPSWGGSVHAQEPTTTTSSTDTPEATEAPTPTTSPTETLVSTETATVTSPPTATPTPLPTDTPLPTEATTDQGCPIGSGMVESGIKQFKAHLTGPGMRWSHLGAERMLIIRTAVLDHNFDALWQAAVQNHPPI
jgi:hypothetical protein